MTQGTRRKQGRSPPILPDAGELIDFLAELDDRLSLRTSYFTLNPERFS